MLVDPDWRRVFISLANKHRSCQVLSYCIKCIADMSPAEVFKVASASAYRDVTEKVLQYKLSEVRGTPW